MSEFEKKKKPAVLLGLLRAAISLLILGGAAGVAAWFVQNPAHTKKSTEHEVRKIYVTTEAISFGNYPIEIDVMGKVSPAREMVLKAQVSGEILDVSEHFIPGGFFNTNDEILKIDPTDYELDVQSKRAVLKQAQAAYRLEQGQQQIAKNEIEILQRNTGKTLKNTDLALRKPQLAQAKADLDAAKTSLALAEINLERATLIAPFNAIVTERYTNLGNLVSAHGDLAKMVSTDEYWVHIDIPLKELPWLVFPDDEKGVAGTRALVILKDRRGVRIGEVYKQIGSVDEQSRLAGVIVRVSDPLLLEASEKKKAYALVLGDFVPVKLIGKKLSNVARVPQQYVRQGDDGDVVWLEQGGKLVIQKVGIVYKDRKFAYITEGLDYAKNIVTSNIVTPVAGMDITVQNNGKDH